MRVEPHQLHERLDRALTPEDVNALQRSLGDTPDQQRTWEEALSLHAFVQTQLVQVGPVTTPPAADAWRRLQQAHPEVNQPAAPPPSPSPWPSWQWLVGLRWVAVAAAILAITWRRSAPDDGGTQGLLPPSSSPSAHQHKGAQPIFRMLHAHRRHDLPGAAYAPAAHTTQGATLRPGDLVQFSYKLPSPRHVMILSLNQRGELFSFIPFKGQASVYIDEPQGTLPKGTSLVLDRYIGPERFLMVSASKPFTFGQISYVLQRIWTRRQKQLTGWPKSAEQEPLLKGWQVTTLLVHKRLPTSPASPSTTPREPR